MATKEALLAKREKVIQYHLNHESVPESPWSPSNPAMQLQTLRGDKILSERPISIQDDDRVFVVGECVSKVDSPSRRS